MESLQHDLAKQITNYHSVWSRLLANTNFGNYASSLWNVTLNTKDVSVNVNEKTFTFHNANFEFDVEVGLSFGDDNTMLSKQVSGHGTFLFVDAKIIQLQTLILN
jgi:hypothetical protein